MFLCCRTWLGGFSPPRCEAAFSFLSMRSARLRKHGADIRIFMLVNQHKMECHARETRRAGKKTLQGILPNTNREVFGACGDKRTPSSMWTDYLLRRQRSWNITWGESVVCLLQPVHSRQVQTGLGTLRCATHPEICRPGWWPAWTGPPPPPPPRSPLLSSQRQLRGHSSSLGQGATGQVISCVFRS